MERFFKLILLVQYFFFIFLFYVPLANSIGTFKGVFLALLIVYTLYLLSFFIQITYIKLSNVCYIRYFILYPFSYDGQWKFQPLNLLYFPEMIMDVLYVNLEQDYYSGTTWQILGKKLRKMQISREVSVVLAFLVVYYLLPKSIGLAPVSYLSLYVLLLTSSFLGKEQGWIGNRLLEGSEEFEEILLSKSYLKIHSPEHFYSYFANKGDDTSNRLLLMVLENLCNLHLLKKDRKIQVEAMADVLARLVRHQYEEGVGYFIRLKYVIYKIGLMGIWLQNENLIYLSKTFLASTIQELVFEQIANGMSRKTVSKLRSDISEFIDCLDCRITPPIDGRFFQMNRPYIFSMDIDQQIIKLYTEK